MGAKTWMLVYADRSARVALGAYPALDREATLKLATDLFASVVDWFAYAQWSGGRLVRSLSLSPDRGVLEDIGERMPFEEPYWSGDHPATEDEDDEYPFPFHPLELGEVVLAELFGYQLEGVAGQSPLAPEKIPLLRYARSEPKKAWQFWR